MGTRNNYRNGRHKEYRIVEKLKKEGFDIVVRSAGSHSPIDVWALNSTTKEIRLVQSKLHGVSMPERIRILKEGEKYAGVYNVIFQLCE